MRKVTLFRKNPPPWFRLQLLVDTFNWSPRDFLVLSSLHVKQFSSRFSCPFEFARKTMFPAIFFSIRVCKQNGAPHVRMAHPEMPGGTSHSKTTQKIPSP